MYAARIRESSLTFEVAGVWRRNMLMRDRETGTIWQHATGEALIGPLQGEQLAFLSVAHTSWVAWRAEHPTTVVAVEPARSAQGLLAFLRQRALAGLLLQVTARLTTPGLRTLSRDLDAHEDVPIRCHGCEKLVASHTIWSRGNGS